MEYNFSTLVETVMTSGIVRAAEVFAAPIFIWWRTKRVKKDWPWPVMLGFVLVVLAACLFLEERLTSAVQSMTYSEEHVVRKWLDEQKYQSYTETDKDMVFKFMVKAGAEMNFSIFEKKETPGILTLETTILLKGDTLERLKKISAEKRQQLWNEIRVELARHNVYLPGSAEDPLPAMRAIKVSHNFTFDRSSHRVVLFSQLNDFMGVKHVVDTVYDSWRTHGQL